MTPAAGRFAGFPDAAVEFYEGLEADNSRAYWAAHKQQYDDCVRAPMTAVLGELEADFGPGTVFRPHRDVRFSKDKSPYKTHQGGFVEVADGVGYYLQVSAAGLLVAGGWHPRGQQILRYREAVLGPDGAELDVELARLTAGGYTVAGDRLSSRPRGQPPGLPREHLTRHKTLEVVAEVGAPAWLAKPVATKRIAAHWRDLTPVVEWLAGHVGPGSDPA